MNIKQTIRNFVLAVFFFVPVVTVSAASIAGTAAADCGGAQTSIINCDQKNEASDKNKGLQVQDTGLWGLLLLAINILTAGVGVLALGGVVYGSVLYTTAGGNPEQVKKARGIFTNVAIGVIAFAGMYALLNFIVPGGVFY